MDPPVLLGRIDTFCGHPMSDRKQLVLAYLKPLEKQRGMIYCVVVACLTFVTGNVSAFDETSLVPLTSIDARDCSGLNDAPDVLFHTKNELDLPSSDTAFVRLAEYDVHDEEVRATISPKDYTGPVQALTRADFTSKKRRYLIAGTLDISGTLNDLQINEVPLDLLTTETIDGPLEMDALDESGYRVSGFRYRLHQLLSLIHI